MNTKIIYLQNPEHILKDFFKSINATEWSLYIKDLNIDNFNNYLFNNHIIKNISERQNNFITENINYSMEKLSGLDTQLKNKNPNLNFPQWKICIYKEMFFNLPFTLEDVIFIPINYINTSMGVNLINKKFSKTLIHEKIHLLQRYNNNEWDNYIISNTNWKIFFPELNFTTCLTNGNFPVYNPDTYYVEKTFYYELNHNKYYGQMILNLGKIKNIWYQIIGTELFPVVDSINKDEHPYEELAYKISDSLIG